MCGLYHSTTSLPSQKKKKFFPGKNFRDENYAECIGFSGLKPCNDAKVENDCIDTSQYAKVAICLNFLLLKVNINISISKFSKKFSKSYKFSKTFVFLESFCFNTNY